MRIAYAVAPFNEAVVRLGASVIRAAQHMEQ